MIGERERQREREGEGGGIDRERDRWVQERETIQRGGREKEKEE